MKPTVLQNLGGGFRLFTHVEEQFRLFDRQTQSRVGLDLAAAVLLVLAALAAGRDVPVSRGESVEIGGSFRVPEVMEQSGARLVDVGTTNRTRPDDYERAVTRPDTDIALEVKFETIPQARFQIEGLLAEQDGSNSAIAQALGVAPASATSTFSAGYTPRIRVIRSIRTGP